MPRRAREGIAPQAPELPDELEAVTIARSAIESGSDWSRVHLTDAALTDLAVPGLGFEESRLERVDLSGGRLANLSFADVELDGCSLANLDARRGAIWRARVVRCRLTGLSWNEGVLRDVILRQCRIDLATFAATRFEQVTFEDCLLTEADFQEASLHSVRFGDCDLSGVDLTGARFDRCELRGCTLDGLRGAERLRGVAMPWEDIVGAAGTFAAALGVSIIDERDH